MYKVFDFNMIIFFGNNCINVLVEILFVEEFIYSFFIFERKEFYCLVYNDKVSFIIEFIKCSLFCFFL